MHYSRIPKIVILFCVLCLFCGSFSGCDSSPAERMTAVKLVIDQSTAISHSVDASITDVNQTIIALELLMNDPNLPIESKPQILLALSAAKTKVNTLILQKQKVDAVLLQAQTMLNSIDMNDLNADKELTAYGGMVTSAAPLLPPGIAGYIYLAGILIPIVGGLIGKIIMQIQKIKLQSQKINDLKKINTDVVTSVDVLLNPAENGGIISAEKVGAAKTLLEHNQLGVTSDAVNAIHDPMKNTGPQ